LHNIVKKKKLEERDPKLVAAGRAGGSESHSNVERSGCNDLKGDGCKSQDLCVRTTGKTRGLAARLTEYF